MTAFAFRAAVRLSAYPDDRGSIRHPPRGRADAGAESLGAHRKQA